MRLERLRPRFFIRACSKVKNLSNLKQLILYSMRKRTSKLPASMGQANVSELLIVGAIVTTKTLTPTVIL